MTTSSTRARREIDRRFRHSDMATLAARPRSGWIRAIRRALGMSQDVLGNRLGVSRVSVTKLEHAEQSGGITLTKLAAVAAALDCQLVYAFVPNSSLEDTLKYEARRIAARQLDYVSATMALEDQDISTEEREEYLDEYAQDLVAHNRVWRSE